MTTKFEFHKKNVLQPEPTHILSNEFDVVKFVGSIHSSIKNDKVVTEDLKLATLTDTEQEYIIDQIKDAYTIKHMFLTYGQEQAQRIFNMLTVQPQLMGILSVNRKDNYLVNSVLKQIQPPDITDTENHKPKQSQPQQQTTEMEQI